MNSDENGPSVTVVVVAEDDYLIRLAVALELDAAGMKVIEVEHADQAREIFDEHAAGVHVLFTDIHMPGSMDGIALAHHVRCHWPWVALIITSGDAKPKPHEMPQGSRFVSKPYAHHEVIAHIRELTT